MKEVNEKIKEIRKFPKDNVRVSITSGDWPVHLLNEWEEDCKRNFNNIRWIKIYQDHKQSKMLEKVIEMFTETKAEVEKLKEKIFLLEHTTVEDIDNEIEPTLGGGEARIGG